MLSWREMESQSCHLIENTRKILCAARNGKEKIRWKGIIFLLTSLCCFTRLEITGFTTLHSTFAFSHTPPPLHHHHNYGHHSHHHHHHQEHNTTPQPSTAPSLASQPSPWEFFWPALSLRKWPAAGEKNGLPRVTGSLRVAFLRN